MTEKSYDKILIWLILIFIFAAFIGTPLGWDFYTSDENRSLAPWPSKNRALTEYPKLIENYFNDHVGFRNALIRRHKKIMRKIEKQNRVTFGTDGWIFYNANIITHDYLGNKQPSPEKTQRIRNALTTRTEYFAQKGINYLVLIPSNKISIYPEKLPKQLQALKGKTNRECLSTLFKSEFPDTVIDLFPVLWNAKKDDTPLYIRTDTHWNYEGAFVAHNGMYPRLKELLPEISPSLKRTQFDHSKKPLKGDIAKMTGTPDDYPIEIEYWTNQTASTWTRTELTNSVFLTKANMPLNHEPPFTIHNPAGKYDVVVFHDSYSCYLMQMLPYYFKNTTFIWHYSNESLIHNAVNICKPDLVIEECLERFLVDDRKGAFLNSIRLENTTHGL